MAAAVLPLRGGLISLRGKLLPASARMTWRRNYGVVTSPTGEKVTHTGHVYEEKDYRRVRFVGRQKEVKISVRNACCESVVSPDLYVPRKPRGNTWDLGLVAASGVCKIKQGYFPLNEVNENFAIDLIAEQPVSEVETRVIWCDGGGGALGHPKVYINLDKDTKTGTCGYCGLQFKQKHHH